MSRFPFLRRCGMALVASGPLLAGIAVAAEPGAAVAKKPDWVGLDRLLWTGDYAGAATAADEIATVVEPHRRDPDFLARSKGFARALMRRGYAECRLGRLDAAAKTFDLAFRTLKDPEFRRVLAMQSRAANAKVTSELVDLDIMLVELADLRMGVILERLRAATAGRDADAGHTTDQDASLAAQVAGWLDDLDTLRKNALQARASLTERFGAAGPAVLSSPSNRSLTGPFGLELIAGATAVECRRLESRVQTTGTSQSVVAEAAHRDWLGEPRDRFAAAARALDEAIAAAAPQGEAVMKPEQRIEALLMRTGLFMYEGEEFLEAGDLDPSLERFTTVVDLLQQIATLRKIPRPESHPDLFLPLVGQAEATLDKARILLEDGDPAGARDSILRASKMLARADALTFPTDHPLRAKLAQLQARTDEDLAGVASTIPGIDAADTAARRLRRAIDRTAFPATPP